MCTGHHRTLAIDQNHILIGATDQGKTRVNAFPCAENIFKVMQGWCLTLNAVYSFWSVSTQLVLSCHFNSYTCLIDVGQFVLFLVNADYATKT